MELAKAQICKEFGDVSALLEVGEAAGFASLGEVLDLEERLDGCPSSDNLRQMAV